MVFGDGSSCHPEIWCDAFAPHEGTDVLARYQGGYGDGEVAVVSKTHGKGRVISLGCPLDEACFMALFNLLATEVGVEPCASGGEGVVCCPRVDPATGEIVALGLVNSRKEAASITIPFGGEDLLNGGWCEGEVTLEPLQVRLVRKAILDPQ